MELPAIHVSELGNFWFNIFVLAQLHTDLDLCSTVRSKLSL